MNDRHLARGKRKGSGDWVEGYYAELPRPMIMYEDKMSPFEWERAEVDPATVGRCTGLRDKNGRLVFEGDSVVADVRSTHVTADVVFDHGKWCLDYDYSLPLYDFLPCEIEIIGNRFDTPELMGVEG